MKVLIVGKTEQGDGACVGGILMDSAQSVRLLPPKGHAHGRDDFEIGQVWEMELRKPGYRLAPPHLEDLYIVERKQLGWFPDLGGYIRNTMNPLSGSLAELYDGFLQFENRHGYISKNGSVPNFSTQFWIPDQNLYLIKKPNFEGTKTICYYKYIAPSDECLIKYKGFTGTISRIEAGTLVRVSLARWYDQGGRTEERCYLQVSGWYE
jgi:hypothetical protein